MKKTKLDIFMKERIYILLDFLQHNLITKNMLNNLGWQRYINIKNLYILFILCTTSVGLHAKRLYADFGIGSDITKISFYDVLDREGTENLTEQSDSYYTFPNINYSLGYRINERFILIADIQSIKIDKHYTYQVEIGSKPWVYDCKLHIKSVGFFGLGMIIYPIERVQLRGSVYIGGPSYREEYIEYSNYGSQEGYGLGDDFGFSLAYDIPIEKFGILIGCRYLNAKVGNITWFSPTSTCYNVVSFGLFTKIKY